MPIRFTIECDVGKVAGAMQLAASDAGSALRSAFQEGAKGIRGDFEKVVETWDDKPAFNVTDTGSPNEPVVHIGTKNAVFFWLDQGTDPHPIPAKNAPWLVFTWGYKGSYIPKTRPGVIGSQAGGPTGWLWKFKAISHPGTAPRLFALTIWSKHKSIVPAIVKRHVEDALRRRGLII